MCLVFSSLFNLQHFFPNFVEFFQHQPEHKEEEKRNTRNQFYYVNFLTLQEMRKKGNVERKGSCFGDVAIVRLGKFCVVVFIDDGNDL
jgi:hypothetical protein